MNSIKIIFFDIDGTLIDMRTKRISEKMLETLIRLKENGIILCIATGRSPISLPFFEGVEFDAFLLQMDGNHPKNKDPRPRRRKDKDNPYTIFTVGINTDTPNYYLSFTDSQSWP